MGADGHGWKTNVNTGCGWARMDSMMKSGGPAGYKVRGAQSKPVGGISMKKLLLLVFLIVAVAGAAIAADVDTKVKTVAAFKNGLAFVYRSGDVQLADGWGTIQEIPPAVLGTVWIGTTSVDAPVEEVIAYKGTMSEAVDALNFLDLLEANLGKSVDVTYYSSDSATEKVRGRVMAVPNRKAPKPEEWSSDSSSRPEPQRGELVLIQQDDGAVIALDKSLIRSVKFGGGSPELKTKIDRPADGAKVRVKGKPKSATITMAYLEKGVTWSPSYLVNLVSDKEADITLDAVLANDVEDLQDTDVSFVVGYPNFAFADTITPLNVQQSVASFVQALMQGRSDRDSLSNVMSQSIMVNSPLASARDSGGWRPDLAYSAGSSMAGETNEDLYFYHQPHVTLKKGDRAKYTVFSAKAPYEHIYLWEVADLVNTDDRGYRQGGDRQDAPEDQVWHSLKLRNATNQPWTTAPALAVKGSMPIAQDVLKYTPPKGQSNLKLTVATDIRAEQSEKEASRKVVNVGHDDFDEITVNGTLQIKSMKPAAVKMNVKKMLTGEVLQSEGGKVSRVTKRLSAVNPKSEIEWDFDLAPGVEKQLTYQYKVLINR